jgi:hypothetical protein
LHPPKKITQNNNSVNKIIAYSAQKKLKQNPSAPHSVLKPETNSDSPSAKSKGVGLVSAKQEINRN